MHVTHEGAGERERERERERVVSLVRGILIHPDDGHFHVVQGGASGCEKGFVKCFLKVFLDSLDSMSAVVQPNGLWNSQKTFYKNFFTT